MSGTGREDGKPLALLSVVTKPAAQQLPVTEIACCVGSRTKDELNDARMLDAIVGHWNAIENGTHRVRDVSMGEDACRVAHPKAARNMATFGATGTLGRETKSDVVLLPRPPVGAGAAEFRAAA